MATMKKETTKPYIKEGFKLPTDKPSAENFVHLEIINYKFEEDEDGIPKRVDIKQTQAFAKESLPQFAANQKAAGATTVVTLYDPSGEDTFAKLMKLELGKELKELKKEHQPSVKTQDRIKKIEKLLDIK